MWCHRYGYDATDTNSTSLHWEHQDVKSEPYRSASQLTTDYEDMTRVMSGAHVHILFHLFTTRGIFRSWMG